MELLAWLRGVEAVVVLALARLLAGIHMRLLLSCMNARVSSSMLSGRGGRTGGGPEGFVKGTLVGSPGMGELDCRETRAGREMLRTRELVVVVDDREPRATCGGVRVGRRALGADCCTRS